MGSNRTQYRLEIDGKLNVEYLRNEGVRFFQKTETPFPGDEINIVRASRTVICEKSYQQGIFVRPLNCLRLQLKTFGPPGPGGPKLLGYQIPIPGTEGSNESVFMTGEVPVFVNGDFIYSTAGFMLNNKSTSLTLRMIVVKDEAMLLSLVNRASDLTPRSNLSSSTTNSQSAHGQRRLAPAPSHEPSQSPRKSSPTRDSNQELGTSEVTATRPSVSNVSATVSKTNHISLQRHPTSSPIPSNHGDDGVTPSPTNGQGSASNFSSNHASAGANTQSRRYQSEPITGPTKPNDIPNQSARGMMLPPTNNTADKHLEGANKSPDMSLAEELEDVKRRCEKEKALIAQNGELKKKHEDAMRVEADLAETRQQLAEMKRHLDETNHEHERENKRLNKGIDEAEKKREELVRVQLEFESLRAQRKG